MQALSLFSGAGGLDLGLEAAGFEIGGCVENDSACRATIRKNGAWQLVGDGDVAGLTATEARAALGVSIGELTLLAGGPPCQPFSKAGQWRTGTTAGLADARAATLAHALRLAEGLLPRVVLLENVPGLQGTRPGGGITGLEFLESEFSRINQRCDTTYQLSTFLVNAIDVGVPQKRTRLFVVADRDGQTLDAPISTHGPQGVHPWTTAWDAIGDLADEPCGPEVELSGRWADLVTSIPEGRNYLWHTDRGGGEPLFGYRTRYWSFLLKLAKSLPSWALSASPGPATGPFHWQNRRLTIREMARLQTFPDSHEFVGSYSAARKQIGNAVPVGLGEAVARHIRRELLGHHQIDPRPVSIPAGSTRCPAPDPVADVPGRFLTLRGTRAAHPGHGLGPGAVARGISNSASVGV